MAGKKEMVLRLFPAQSRTQRHVVQEVIRHTAQGLDALAVDVLIGLHAVTLACFPGIRHVKDAAINAQQATPLPALYFSIGPIQPIEVFNHAIIQMLKERRMQFLARLAVGARGWHLSHPPKGLKHPMERMLENALMTSEYHRDHHQKGEFALPRPRCWLETIPTDHLGTGQSRPYAGHDLRHFFLRSSPPPLRFTAPIAFAFCHTLPRTSICTA